MTTWSVLESCAPAASFSPERRATVPWTAVTTTGLYRTGSISVFLGGSTTTGFGSSFLGSTTTTGFGSSRGGGGGGTTTGASSFFGGGWTTTGLGSSFLGSVATTFGSTTGAGSTFFGFQTAGAGARRQDLVYHPNGRLYLATVRGLYTKEFAAQLWDKIASASFENSDVTGLLYTETNLGMLWLNTTEGVYTYPTQ